MTDVDRVVGPGYEMVDMDNMGDLMVAMPGLKAKAMIEMAREMNRAMIATYESNGFGSWPQNSPITEELKGGIKKPMKGRTGTMARMLVAENAILERKGLERQRPASGQSKLKGLIGEAELGAVAGLTKMVSVVNIGRGDQTITYGWPDDVPHPDTGGQFDPVTGDIRPRQETGRLSIADVALINELGSRNNKFPNLPGGDEAPIPPRPWLTLAADLFGPRITKEGADALGDSIEAFNNIPISAARLTSIGSASAATPKTFGLGTGGSGFASVTRGVL